MIYSWPIITYINIRAIAEVFILTIHACCNHFVLYKTDVLQVLNAFVCMLNIFLECLHIFPFKNFNPVTNSPQVVFLKQAVLCFNKAWIPDLINHGLCENYQMLQNRVCVHSQGQLAFFLWNNFFHVRPIVRHRKV